MPTTPDTPPVPSAPPGPESRPLVGALWMLAAGLAFVGMAISVKWVGQSIPAVQNLFLRYLVGLVFVLPLIPAMRRAGLNRADLGGHFLRGAVHCAGAVLWYFAIARIPLAEVTAMGYLQPIYMTLGAALFLGERLALRRMLAIGFAIIGVLIVLRPGFRELGPGQLAMLGCTVMMSTGYLLAKRLSLRTSPEAVLGWMSITIPLLLAPFAVWTWQPVSLDIMVWIFLSAGFATLGHWLMLRAFAAAPIAVTQPVTFLQLLWSVLVGWLVFQEPVDAFVILGGAVIVTAVVYIVMREARLKRLKAAAE